MKRAFNLLTVLPFSLFSQMRKTVVFLGFNFVLPKKSVLKFFFISKKVKVGLIMIN